MLWFVFVVFKSGMFCSLFDVMEKDKTSQKSLTALLQKLEEEGLVSINPYSYFAAVCT